MLGNKLKCLIKAQIYIKMAFASQPFAMVTLNMQTLRDTYCSHRKWHRAMRALKWIPNNNRDKFEQQGLIGCFWRRGEKKDLSSLLMSSDLNASNCWLSLYHKITDYIIKVQVHAHPPQIRYVEHLLHLRYKAAWSGMFPLSYSKRGRRIRVAGCIWMDSCSCDELLQRNLPPTSCFLQVAMATWCVCMPQTLVWLLTWLLCSDSWMHIRACTNTLDPKAATVGDYQQRKWLLKCLSPTHAALDQKLKVWITRHWLLQSFFCLDSPDKLNRSSQRANFVFC